MKISSPAQALFDRLCWAAHWRCAEPVVVFESDDWGLQRGGNIALFRQYGNPKDWAAEQTETPQALNALFDVLESQRDSSGRPAVFTANFITANPDFEAIEKNGYSRYEEIPINARQDLRLGWMEGLQRHVFYPQYHGRSHFWVENWLEDLRRDKPGARALFREQQHGGLALMQKANWCYHSEYVNWNTGEMRSGEELHLWLHQGLSYFEETFGFRPLSAIAPHYILPAPVLKVFAQAGLRFLQGGNYHILRRRKSRKEIILNHTLGEPAADDLLFLARNVHFEPRPAYAQRGVEAAWRQIVQCFQAGIPVIIDTHRINYTGPWQVEARLSLSELLGRLARFQPRFLTTIELGHAVRTGQYQDVWSGEIRPLPERDGMPRRALRRLCSLFNTLRALQA